MAHDTTVASPDFGTAETEATEAGFQAAIDAGVQETGGEVGTFDATVDAGGRPEIPPPPPATIIVLPDTQYYSYGYPEVYAQQTSWILDRMRALRIQAVLHVGDLVDGFNDAQQWTHASTAMRVLDNLVPYVIVPGNHDTDANRQTPINTYFGPASMPWIAKTRVAGQIENSYALLDIGAQQWLVLGLEFGPRDVVVAWADSVLKDLPQPPGHPGHARLSLSRWQPLRHQHLQGDPPGLHPPGLRVHRQPGHQRRRDDVAEAGAAQPQRPHGVLGP